MVCIYICNLVSKGSDLPQIMQAKKTLVTQCGPSCFCLPNHSGHTHYLRISKITGKLYPLPDYLADFKLGKGKGQDIKFSCREFKPGAISTRGPVLN